MLPIRSLCHTSLKKDKIKTLCFKNTTSRSSSRNIYLIVKVLIFSIILKQSKLLSEMIEFILQTFRRVDKRKHVKVMDATFTCFLLLIHLLIIVFGFFFCNFSFSLLSLYDMILNLNVCHVILNLNVCHVILNLGLFCFLIFSV